ncbi:MAG: DsbA family protein [Chloroflexi bacterium]|nr:DsbA family protein [Chloroflexota bacterium]MBU1660113.1 DsbA family protein [Chloroflexota bacterium]
MNNRQTIKERRRHQKKQQRLITILIASGVALILAVLLVLPTIRYALTPVGEFVQPPLVPRPMANGNTMGDPNAPVLIEEFSDFACGYCGVFPQETGAEIENIYVSTGKVYFISRSSGSLIGHLNTPLAAEAAYCAADQNKYWEYQDIVFANQRTLFADPTAKIDKFLAAFAESLELDMGAFDDCVDSRKYRDRVRQDELDAIKANISATPSFLINGMLLEGAQPFAEFEKIIEAELATTGN